MRELMKQIRSAADMSQKELAEYMGVTFATVNRWENSKATPNRIAQEKLYELCQMRSIPLYDYILKKIEAEVAALHIPKDRLVLYHGSKAGIEGEITLLSRDKCDFGKGFYMGTQPEQSLTLVCDFDKSKFYVMSIDLKGLDVLDVPADIEWAMLVAFHRGKMDQIKGSAFYKKYKDMSGSYDIVVGSIANDRMFYVLDNFFLGNITDLALVNSLSALQFGRQYVCATEKACKAVRIEKEIELSHLERKCLQKVSEENRAKGVSLADDICRNYRREGLFFDEIIEENR